MKGIILISLLLVLPLSIFLSGQIFQKTYPEIKPPGAILITGASTGIGRVTAFYLAEKGFYVYAGVRREKDRASFDGVDGVEGVVIDVTVPETIDACFDVIQQGGKKLVGVVNNAGVSNRAPLEFADVENMEWMMDVNLFGVVRVTQKFMPILRQNTGRIVNVGSVLGEIALPFSGEYVATKFALRAMSDVWRREMNPWNVYVGMVEPSYVKSAIQQKGVENVEKRWNEYPDEAKQFYGSKISPEGARERYERTGPLQVPAEDVSEAIHHALTSPRPKARYLVGYGEVIVPIAKTILPDALLDFVISKMFWPQNQQF
eukprot:TRINITY_DN2216_c0_g1_i1.p1 TRINITY_DN2216_c0_g1~~TRINITY_DN2216_c0_g1_i1.p1  ORF type:complete len:332 (+),score=70.27 TRINITY_DN2216_c0_g1_i1:47-997(+)